jgi:hypothetical protein
VLTDADEGRAIEVPLNTLIIIEYHTSPKPDFTVRSAVSTDQTVLQPVDLGPSDAWTGPLAEYRAVAVGKSVAQANTPQPASCPTCLPIPIGIAVTVLPMAGMSSGSPPPDRSSSAPVRAASRPVTLPSPEISSSHASVPPSSRPPRVVLTNADIGQSTVVAVGAIIEVDVHVFSPGALSISAPISDDDTVLHQVSASPGGASTSAAVFLASAPGQSEISVAEQGPPCASGVACAAAFGIGFYITVVR